MRLSIKMRLRTYYILTFLVLQLVPNIALAEDWVHAGGGLYTDCGKGIVTNNNGEVYITGQFNSYLPFGKDTLFTSNKETRDCMFLAKLDNTGKLLWYKTSRWDGSGKCIMIDKENNVVVSGIGYDFGDTIFSKVSRVGFVMKISPSGNLIWAKSLGYIDEPGMFMYQGTMHGTVDNENNILINYLSEASVNFDNYSLKLGTSRGIQALVKLNAKGKPLWVKGIWAETQGELTGIAVDLKNNIYISGYNMGKVVVNNNDVANKTTVDRLALLKLTSEGNYDWSISGDVANGVTTDSLGYIYAVGKNWFTVSPLERLDSKNINKLLKINSSGNIIWEQLIPNSNTLVKTDKNNNIYISSFTDVLAKIDNDSIEYGDRYLCKLDSMSNVIYIKPTGKGAEYYDMAIDDNENVYFTGGYFNAVFSDSIGPVINYIDPYNNDTIYSKGLIGQEYSNLLGYYNFFVQKLCKEVQKNYSSIPANVENIPFEIYPNPVSSTVRINLSNFTGQEIKRISLYSQSGNIVKSVQPLNKDSKYIELNCSSFPSGIYLICVDTKNKSFSRKLVVINH
jgi:hypothetical protein